MGAICSSDGAARHRSTSRVQRFHSKPLARPISIKRVSTIDRNAGGAHVRLGGALGCVESITPAGLAKGFDCPIVGVPPPASLVDEAEETSHESPRPEDFHHHPLDTRLALRRPSMKGDTDGLVEMQSQRLLAKPPRLMRKASTKTVPDGQFYSLGLGPARPGPNEDRLGAPLPTNESYRLSILGNFRILDTPSEPKYDRLTSLTAKLFQTPVALISLVDEKRQWFKSELGLGIRETDRESSFCAYLLLPSSNPCLVVENALQDKRFYRSKLVTGEPYIRFYAGAPLLTSSNVILGSLCIIDFVPRTFSDHDCDLLMTLAGLVTVEIEKHTQALELQRVQVERFEEDKRGLLQAIDAFNEGLVLADVAQQGEPIVFVNEGFERITGYSIQDVIGENCGNILQGEKTNPAAKAVLREAIQESKSASVEILNYRRDGTPFWNWLRIRPVEDNYVDPLKKLAESPSHDSSPSSVNKPSTRQYYFGIISDITSRKQKEEELAAIKMAEMKTRASQLAKREFVANISHEIRTPINAIIACSQLLHDMSSLNAEQVELAQMISGSGQQLLCLVNDILDFSKLEAGKMDLQVHEFNVWQCVDFCMEMLRLKCEDKGLDLSFSVDPDVPMWIWSDEVRLRQIIANLLSNAAKFTEEGGEIDLHVTARPLPPDKSDTTATATGTKALGSAQPDLPKYEVQVTVRDTGIGMPADFQKVIFEAFTQCDNSRTRKYEGTGLGMAISKDLTERMGGRIWVDSQIGKGSAFHFTITTSGSFCETKGMPISRQAALTRPRLPISGLRALLVGESPIFQRMVGSLLLSWGLESTIADSVLSFHNLWDCPPPTAKDSTKEEEATLQNLASGDTVILDENHQERVASGSFASTTPLENAAQPPHQRRPGKSQRGGRSQSQKGLACGRLFDFVVMDCPRPGRDGKEGGPCLPGGSGPAGGQGAIPLVDLACSCGKVLTTLMLCPRPKYCPLDRTRLKGVEILSKPVRVQQFYNAVCRVLAREEQGALCDTSGQNNGQECIQGAPQASQCKAARTIQLLIADDNLVNQKVLVKLLRSLGQESCLTAINGAKVLEQMRAHTFDLILMDLQMPVMDGLTATSTIRAEWPKAQQPFIVALTADVGAGVEMECKTAGMNSYLSKPVMKESLDRILTDFVHLKDSGKWTQAAGFWLDSFSS